MPAESQNNIILLVLIGLSVLLFVWNILIQIAISKIKKSQKLLFSGTKAQNLENIILQSKTKISSMDNDIKDLYEITTKIHSLAHKSLHKVGTLRFNPFRDLGGDQSFAVALLDGDNNGVVISSLYSREGVRIYAKSIQKGASVKYPLTEEEKHAIKTASLKK